ncbi:MAG: N-acetylmuramic acid 6-phosphate etherase [Anaerolineaceae bacterium]|nr:N-acetylmuramic acid 6-phosphate etherase [Anaerolineaceae bacterium]
MLTEQRNPKSMGIDQSPTLEILQIINEEDATIAGAIRQVLPAIAEAVDMISERMRNGGRLFYTGAGTSGRLGILDAVECVPTFSVSPELVQGIIAGGEGAVVHSIEGAEDSPEGGRDDLIARSLTAQDAVVGIAASGRTPYVVGALNYARQIGAGTVGISCNAPAPVLDTADIAIAALVGPEILTGSTRLKSGTAQKLILNMISTTTMIKLGKVYNNLMVDVKVSNAKLADRARRIVSEVTGLSTDEAAALLNQTHNEVKPAIVMAVLGVSVEEARTRLDAAQGMLGAVIGQR